LRGNVFFVGDFDALEDSITVINSGQRKLPYANVFFDWYAFCPNPHKAQIDIEIPLYDHYEKFYLGKDNTGELNENNILWLNQTLRPPRKLTEIQINTLIFELRIPQPSGEWLAKLLQQLSTVTDDSIALIEKFLKQPEQKVLNPSQIDYVVRYLKTLKSDDLVVGMLNRSDYIALFETPYLIELYKIVLSIFSLTNIGGSAILKIPLANIPFLDGIYLLFASLFPVLRLIKLKENNIDDDTVYLIGTKFNLGKAGNVILETTQLNQFLDFLNTKIKPEVFLNYLTTISGESIKELHQTLNQKLETDLKNWIERLMTENGGWKYNRYN
jgi:hypothetical protein